MTQNRVLPLTGVHNFRDYGDYAVAGGGRVKSGLLWRSAQHGEATDADLDAIQGLGINTVIDLRGNAERKASPCRRHDDFSAEVLWHDGETAGLHLEAAEGALTTQHARDAMLKLYEGIAWRENLLPMIRRYFDAVEQRHGASLVHCVAGKDRTGFACALLQHVLGVHQDDIVADYVLTNVAGNIDKRIAQGGSQIRQKWGGIDDETIRTLMGVDEEYIAATIKAIVARHGSIDAYLDEVIGLADANRAALRERYLA